MTQSIASKQKQKKISSMSKPKLMKTNDKDAALDMDDVDNAITDIERQLNIDSFNYPEGFRIGPENARDERFKSLNLRKNIVEFVLDDIVHNIIDKT
jgi:hypothetical protein